MTTKEAIAVLDEMVNKIVVDPSMLTEEIRAIPRKARAEKAEAEVSSMVKGHVALLEAEKYLRGRCNKAEAELERARPLLEAVDKANLEKAIRLFNEDEDYLGDDYCVHQSFGIVSILRSALAYRSAK